MSVADSGRLGLRERSKIKRRRQILFTALSLFAERGYERTTIADIAEASEVAPRTVSGYFPSKLDFITEWPLNRSRRLVQLYDQNPDIGFVELIDLFWHDARHHLDREEADLTFAMALANPGVVAMAELAALRQQEAEASNLPEHIDPRDDILKAAGRAAISGLNKAFLTGIAGGRMTDELHAVLLDLVRSIAVATDTGHGALQLGP